MYCANPESGALTPDYLCDGASATLVGPTTALVNAHSVFDKGAPGRPTPSVFFSRIFVCVQGHERGCKNPIPAVAHYQPERNECREVFQNTPSKDWYKSGCDIAVLRLAQPILSPPGSDFPAIRTTPIQAKEWISFTGFGGIEDLLNPYPRYGFNQIRGIHGPGQRYFRVRNIFDRFFAERARQLGKPDPHNYAGLEPGDSGAATLDREGRLVGLGVNGITGKVDKEKLNAGEIYGGESSFVTLSNPEVLSFLRSLVRDGKAEMNFAEDVPQISVRAGP